MVETEYYKDILIYGMKHNGLLLDWDTLLRLTNR